MTDEPTKNPSDQPAEPDQPTTPPPPPTPPAEPSGVGFAAVRLPGQQTPSQPPATPQGHQAASPASPAPPPQPPSAPSPPPAYQFDYSRIPVTRSQGPSILLVGAIAFALVLVAGLGSLFAFGIGPFARPTARPAPTLVAQPTPTSGRVTPAPSGVVSPAPSPSAAGPSATPIGDPEEALRSHIPAAIVGTCFLSAPDDPGAILAIAVCDADDGDIRVTYFQYASHDRMFSAYSGFRLASQIEPDSGDCDDPASWPTENSYRIDGVTAGRLLCTEELSETSIYWTDDRLNILSQATHKEGKYERLVEFWRSESGPDL
jgi:hypothetical protein